MPLLRSFVAFLGYKDKEFKKVKPDHLVTTHDGVRDIYDLLRKRAARHLDEKPPTPAGIFASESKVLKGKTSPMKPKSPAQIKDGAYDTPRPKTPTKAKETPKRKKVSDTESEPASSARSVAPSSKRISKASSSSGKSS